MQRTCKFKLCVPREPRRNIELIKVINFIEQTMTTLSSYGKRLKAQLDFNLTQQDK